MQFKSHSESQKTETHRDLSKKSPLFISPLFSFHHQVSCFCTPFLFSTISTWTVHVAADSAVNSVSLPFALLTLSIRLTDYALRLFSGQILTSYSCHHTQSLTQSKSPSAAYSSSQLTKKNSSSRSIRSLAFFTLSVCVCKGSLNA